MKINCLLKNFFFILSNFLFHQISSAQVTNISTLKVFFDCQSYGCDFDYIRTELKWIDFVRDKTDADIHILITSQPIDGGGKKTYLNFIGHKAFHDLSDTISYLNNANNTADETRKLMVQYLKLGLVRYVSRTNLAETIEITHKSDGSETKNVLNTKDPWNSWVFNIGARGNFNGSQVYKSSSFGSNFSANRTTEKIKTGFEFNYSYRISKSKYDTETIKVTSKNIDTHFGNAYSINDHWSWGYDLTYSNSLFSNIKARIAFYPKIEFNIYPYSVSNSKSITFGYYIGPEYNRYYDTTVFFETKELLYKQNITTSASFAQPWGNINAGVFYSNYFHDFSKNNLSIITSVNIRLLKGLSLNIFGDYSIVHDQISLPKGTATRDDILTQRRLIFSGYNYYMSVGLQYRFGSKFNNVVNPRFGGLHFFF